LSWSVISPNSNRDDSSAAYASSLSVHWMGDLEIDPFNHDVAMFTTGYGIYRTTNLTSATPLWSFFNDGLEESAAGELVSPNTGSVNLFSAIGDRDGVCAGGHRGQRLLDEVVEPGAPVDGPTVIEEGPDPMKRLTTLRLIA
jgi:hypothetical protein